MILIFSILSAAVYCSLAGLVSAQEEENYSLWPRRPAELAQARSLVRAQKNAEALEVLQPFVAEKGIAGREARQITSAVNVRRYLTQEHPGLAEYKVRRGDTLKHIADVTKCPGDVIMLLNGMVEPSDLKVGQSVVYIPMSLRMEIHVRQRELMVWDGSVLVAAYNLDSVEGNPGSENVETEIERRDGYLGDSPLPNHATVFAASERVLVLANGWVISARPQNSGKVLRMKSTDVNELALLMGVGGRVSFVCDENSFRASQISSQSQ